MKLPSGHRDVKTFLERLCGHEEGKALRMAETDFRSWRRTFSAGPPDAHLCDFAAYEESALKRLAMLHGTRESATDDLPRGGKLIGLSGLAG